MGELTENVTDTPAEAEVNVEVARCGNCGVALLGTYCSDCGQEDRAVRRPFWRILRQLFHAVFELDGRVYRSLYFLYTRPGFLSTEYLNGRRARYTPPLRMFLVLSISFFLIVSIAGTFGSIFLDEADLNVALAAGETDAEALQQSNQPIRDLIAGETEDEDLAELDLSAQDVRAFLEQLEFPFLPAATGQQLQEFIVDQATDNYAEMREDPLGFFRDFIGESLEYVTIFILLMMPLLALVQWALFIFKGRYYVEHFILTLHNHSYLIVSTYLLALTGVVASQIPVLAGFVEWVDFVIVMWAWIYLYLSLKFFYGTGYIYSGLAYVVASAIYGSLIISGLTVFLVIAFLLY
ncbi:MAG: DUF3667 domain-containing protein [Gammaproteobacteria bacterium]|nr:DUF3667 domain-containing protein [Gammaproteobacteria bacterium]MCY3690152.1 DUF3667 domain-containing protein [Gammaproteobacteria bacterium]MDE0479116.1 DUF3667 domain-containing protein [Gammaproteobacteria bacterium]MDE0507913.1 DUF3667 domain-containing protein [Gammaproteobacteria bacterium]MXX06030.1 DUF3667 domain-containing protein [Gammaproteobacteria bacterium]